MSTMVVARGNHRDGYVGVLMEDWGKPSERDVWKCSHKHWTTKEARDCARAHREEPSEAGPHA